MRTIDKGVHPLGVTGEPIPFERYQDAAPYLKDRLGRYCNFCERPIKSSLAVEHMLPKAKYESLAKDWTNLLLACSNCNSSKGVQEAKQGECIWPDEDDTFLALVYGRDGSIKPSADLGETMASRAVRLIGLTGLDRPPLSTPSDHRWPDRLEVWSHAEHSRKQLADRDTPAMRQFIVNTALGFGGFSIWMTVFAGDLAMRQALVAAFPGTVMRGTPAEEL